jgi:hypothetical protein
MRTKAWTGIVILGLAAVLSAHPIVAATLEVSPACDGSGFSGIIRDGSTGVRFSSCASEKWCRVKVWKASGEEMTEMVEEGTDLTVWMGGFRLSDHMTEEQAKSLEPLMQGPEADLVRCFYPSLRTIESTLPSSAAGCFEAHGQAYEGPTKAPCPSFTVSSKFPSPAPSR